MVTVIYDDRYPSITISRAKLEAYSEYFKAMFRHDMEEKRTGSIRLKEDEPVVIRLILDAIKGSQPCECLLRDLVFRGCCPAPILNFGVWGLHKKAWADHERCSHLRIVNQMHITTDKYMMTELHSTVSTKMLPHMWTMAMHSNCSEHAQPTAPDFVEYHYAFFKSQYNLYPKEFWPIFLQAYSHYQRQQPDDTTLDEILKEEPELATYLRIELKKQVVHLEDRTKRLEKQMVVIRNGLAQMNEVMDP